MLKIIKNQIIIVLIISMFLQLFVGVTPVMAEDLSDQNTELIEEVGEDIVEESEFVQPLEVKLSPGTTAGAISATIVEGIEPMAVGQYSYIDENGETKYIGADTVIKVTPDTNTLDGGWYIVEGTINRTGTITVSGHVHLILGNNSSLTVSGNDNNAGIHVSGGNSITIYSQSKGEEMGSLHATGAVGAAGIGGGYDGDGGTININGGTVTATGGESAAGIGGGYNCVGVNIEINNGTVTATGGRLGAGIGGGALSSVMEITINGGIINATGNVGGAGIGGGYEGGGGTIIINGGTINAIGLSGGAGIGSGVYSENGSIIHIDGNANIAAVSLGGENKPAIDAQSDSSGIIINATLQTPISNDYAVYLKSDSSILKLPAGFKGFAFSPTYNPDNFTYNSKISVYSDESCTIPKGRIITDFLGGIGIKIPSISLELEQKATLVKYNIPITDGNVNISGVNESYIYTGNIITPEPIVEYENVILEKDRDYAVQYRDNIWVGTAEIVITFIGIYSGSVTRNFKIISKTYNLGPEGNEAAVTGTVDSNGTLTITGSGPMGDYETESPLKNYPNIKSVVINNGVTTIGSYVFFYLYNLESVTIPSSVTNIKNDAFRYCTKLKSITIPSSVESIGNSAFYGCSSLAAIVNYCSNNQIIGNNAFVTRTAGTKIATAYNSNLNFIHAAQSAGYTIEYFPFYTVSFDANGGETPSPVSKFVNDSGTYGDLAVVIRTGYTFNGWFTALTGGTKVETTTTINNSDHTLYAQWTINQYNISFDSAGGTPVESITQNYGTAVAVPVNPTKEGHTFKGWQPALPSTVPAENKTHTAQWETNKYTITFDSDGGTPVNSITQDYGTAVAVPVNPTKEGHTFKGWQPALPSTVPAENKTHAAQWETNKYTITFDSDGGTPVDTITQSYGTKLTEPVNIFKEGYIFDGWYKEDKFINKWEFATDTVTADMTLYAKWTVAEPVAGFGNALNFYKSRINVDFDDNTKIGGNSNFTISMWILPKNEESSQTLYRQYSENDGSLGVWFRYIKSNDNEGYLYFGFDKFGNHGGWQWAWDWNNGIPPSTVTKITMNRWTHVTLTKSEKSIIVYANGTKYYEMTLDDMHYYTPAPTNANISIGGPTEHDFNGFMDEVQFWNTALTPAEIQAWMYREIDGSHNKYSNLIYYYKLNEASGTAVTDSKGSYDGTAVNMTDNNRVVSYIQGWTVKAGEILEGRLVGSHEAGSSTDGTNWNLAFEILEQGEKGRVTITEDNKFEYSTHDINQEGNDSFSYRVKGSNEKYSNTHNVNINIIEANSISGNAGTAGATISYTDKIVKAVTTDAYGNYSFKVSNNWSGIVTPNKDGYTFDPADKLYTDVQENQTGQNYTATALIPVAGDYNIDNLEQTYGNVTDVSITPKTGKSDGAITIYYESSGGTTYTKSETVPTAAGTYTVTFDVAQTSGWHAVTDLSAGTLTITKATGEDLNITSYNNVYDGKSHSIEVTNTITVDTVNYSTNGGENWSTTNPTFTDSGEYTVKVKVENPNYGDRLGEGTVTITKKEVIITTDNKTKVYGETDPTFTGTITGLVGENDLGEIINSRTNTPENNVGIYNDVINATYTTNSNYTVTVNKGDFEIAKATGTELQITNYEGIYDGEAHGITVTNIIEGDTVKYSTDGGENWSATNPAFIDAGEYTVKVKVENLNYEDRLGEGTVTITRRSSGGGVPKPHQPIPERVVVIVNGQEHNTGIETKTTENGKSTVTIKVNSQIIESKIDEAVKKNPGGTGNVINVPVTDTDSQVAIVELTGDIVKKLEENTFDIIVKQNHVEYIIPAEEIAIDNVAEALKVDEKNLKDIRIEVKITYIDEDVIAKYNEMVNANGAVLVYPPVGFEIVAKTTKPDGSTKETAINKFSIYVERVIEIPQEVDPIRITTGIVFNPDGTYSHVPTTVYEKDGKWYAKINSLTNSTYSIIWNPITVKSVEGHWSRETVNDMASKLIIYNPETFEPDMAITREDFAEYIVRALGLYRKGDKLHNKFTDISNTGASTLAILIANEYEIVNGYPDGTFKPSQQITREEAMAMLQRAMQITKLTGSNGDRYLNYTDFSEVSSWAENCVKEALSAHVFNGTSETIISPKSNLTYAETAQSIKNLLVESNLINTK
jgi:uncharacterized repeat protein (TIGR02543 family)